MKRNTIIATLGLASLLSFGASAATQISADQAQNLQPMGSVSISQTASSPMSIREQLSAKADRAGASSYRVTELQEGDTWHATAELYK
ncbi:peroxide/acid stress response protein YhcN [Yokenella regensburgei]|uniref:peroxide/acid stress response protein YhcN n=1 Tax=Yokenella regensburgei TaxID=158877 RepID=UPI003F18D8A4